MTTHPQFLPPRTRPFDPPDLLADARAAERLAKVVLWDGRQAWLVTRYADARSVLSDPRFSSDINNPGLPSLRPGLGIARHRAAIVRMDQPRHGEIRRMVAHEFTQSRIAELRPTIDRIIAEQLDALLAATPPVDLRAAFALPIPSRLICELLGVPLADQDYFQECTRQSRALGLTREQGVAAELRMYDYCEQLVAGKEQAPTVDLIGRLILDQVRPGRLRREELVTLVKALINAGHETTASMICLAVLTMLLHPDWFRVMRERSDALPDAVEELLRYHTVVHDGLPRVATEDVRVGTTTIRAGDGVVVSVAAANRDGAMFAQPDRLDAGRAGARRHLAFGHGPHLCLGLWLARAELQIALPALATRVPTLRLAVSPARLRFSEDMQIYGVPELPVTW